MNIQMIAKLSMICSKQSNGSYSEICPEVRDCFTQGEFKLPLPTINSALETPVWDEKTEHKFQSALDNIDKKYGHALKKLADTQ